MSVAVELPLPTTTKMDGPIGGRRRARLPDRALAAGRRGVVRELVRQRLGVVAEDPAVVRALVAVAAVRDVDDAVEQQQSRAIEVDVGANVGFATCRRPAIRRRRRRWPDPARAGAACRASWRRRRSCCRPRLITGVAGDADLGGHVLARDIDAAAADGQGRLERLHPEQGAVVGVEGVHGVVRRRRVDHVVLGPATVNCDTYNGCAYILPAIGAANFRPNIAALTFLVVRSSRWCWRRCARRCSGCRAR